MVALETAPRGGASVQDSRGIVCHEQQPERPSALLETKHRELGSTCVSYVTDEADLVLGFGYDGDVRIDRPLAVSQ